MTEPSWATPRRERDGRSNDLDRAVPGRPDPINRHPDDFYRTPRRAIEALLDREEFRGSIWEPACGDGAISEVLRERMVVGEPLFSTDLFDRGFGDVRDLDFLSDKVLQLFKTDHVITNPPFKLAQAFAERALEVSSGKVALLCRTLWLEGGKRKLMFESTPLKSVYVFSSRVNVARGGDPKFADGVGGMVSFAWFVWDKAHVGPPTLGWL